MGDDPQTSVAGPWGELHDTPGVWIGDASAFPTSSGTNPMITIMALAHRTAEAIAAAAPAPAGARASRPPPRPRRTTRGPMATTAADSRSATGCYIGGEWVEPAGSETIEVINPPPRR